MVQGNTKGATVGHRLVGECVGCDNPKAVTVTAIGDTGRGKAAEVEGDRSGRHRDRSTPSECPVIGNVPLGRNHRRAEREKPASEFFGNSGIIKNGFTRIGAVAVSDQDRVDDPHDIKIGQRQFRVARAVIDHLGRVGCIMFNRGCGQRVLGTKKDRLISLPLGSIMI